jgi:uncharacterized membrane protein YebE (DUF533 family)
VNSKVKDLTDEYVQLRRVLVQIAIANEDIDEQERMVIASSIGGSSGLNDDQVKTLLEDATTKPDIKDLVEEISHPVALKQMLLDLVALALMKPTWHEAETRVLRDAVMAMGISESNRLSFLKTFESLQEMSQTIQ